MGASRRKRVPCVLSADKRCYRNPGSKRIPSRSEPCAIPMWLCAVAVASLSCCRLEPLLYFFSVGALFFLSLLLLLSSFSPPGFLFSSLSCSSQLFWLLMVWRASEILETRAYPYSSCHWDARWTSFGSPPLNFFSFFPSCPCTAPVPYCTMHIHLLPLYSGFLGERISLAYSVGYCARFQAKALLSFEAGTRQASAAIRQAPTFCLSFPLACRNRGQAHSTMH